MQDLDFVIKLGEFQQGFAPLAHLDAKTYVGASGQASEMKADIISSPGFLIQSPGLVDLTNGTQAGVVDQLIRFILDQPVNATDTYGIGTSKLFKLNATTVVSGGSPSWPQAITNMTEGESLVALNGNLYGFFNKASGGDIFKMVISTGVIDHTWGSVTDQALEKAPHPSAKKEDIMVFGNGRYLGVYVEGLAILDVRKLDFGEGAEVVDVLFHANNWWIAVNSNGRSQIYMYDGSAISNILSDEAGIGEQEIGFLYLYSGVIYIAYYDDSSNGFTIGYLSGRVIKPLRYFSGTLPDHRQKTLYKNTILFLSGADIWSCGSSVGQLPIQMSKLADGGYATLGGLGSPFGTPMIASTDGAGNFRLAKFSGYSVDSSWKSIVIDLTSNKNLGKVVTIIVNTKALVGSAKATIKLEGNQGAVSSSEFDIETAGKTRHIFKVIDLKAVEDVRVIINYAESDTTNSYPIRSIILLGGFVEN